MFNFILIFIQNYVIKKIQNMFFVVYYLITTKKHWLHNMKKVFVYFNSIDWFYFFGICILVIVIITLYRIKSICSSFLFLQFETHKIKQWL
jgi:hypothetical protein